MENQENGRLDGKEKEAVELVKRTIQLHETVSDLSDRIELSKQITDEYLTAISCNT